MSGGKAKREARAEARRSYHRDDNRWIVSAHNFLEHGSPRLAETELNRLRAKEPDRFFRMYRIKRVVTKPEQRRRPQRWFARMVYALLVRVDRWT